MPRARVRLPLLFLSLIGGVALTGATACKEPAPAEAAPTTKSEVVELDLKPKRGPDLAPTTDTPTLASVLDAKAAASAANRSAEKAAIMQGAIDQLGASDILENALAVGAKAPDFTLPGADGKPVNLQAMLERGPVVLLWYRGSWCPYCNLTLAGYSDAAKQLAAAGATLVAISPELPDDSLRELDEDQRGEFGYPILSDVGNAVAKQYGIVFALPEDLAEMYNAAFSMNEKNGDESNELPLAATYVIGQDGVVAWAFLDVDYKKRAEPADVVAAARGLAD